MYPCDDGHPHGSFEEYRACLRKQAKRERRIGMTIMLTLLILLVAATADLLWNQFAYGDWKCAFIECRKLVP